MSILVRAKYFGKNEHIVDHYTTKLDQWLKGKELEFSPIKGVTFNKGMTMAVVEFDKDHCIYILLEESCFRK